MFTGTDWTTRKNLNSDKWEIKPYETLESTGECAVQITKAHESKTESKTSISYLWQQRMQHPWNYKEREI